MKKTIVITRYIYISARRKILKQFGGDGNDLIFRSPKSLFEFLEKIDYSKYYLSPSTKTADLKDFDEEERGMSIYERNFSEETKIFYVETKFPSTDKMIFENYGGVIFGKKFYFSENSVLAKNRIKRIVFIIIFSHGVCAYCDVDVCSEDSVLKEMKIVEYEKLDIGRHIRDIILDEHF
jgi:hypothetical protein